VKSRWPLSFQQKLTAVTMLASAMALVLTFATLLPLRRAELVADEKTNLESLAQVVGDSSKAALSFRDERVGREALASLAIKPTVVAAAIYTADGRQWLLYRGPGRKAPALPSQPGRAGFHIVDGTATVFHPVTMDGESLGTIYLEADISELAARGRSYALTLLLIMVVCAAASFGLAAKLQGALSRPIGSLVGAARRVSEERDYSLRVAPSGARELQDLAVAFNGMLARIEEQDAALRAARDGLEERVRERVADVQREVTERRHTQKALQESERRYRSIVETTNEWIWSIDADGTSQYNNPAVEQILGWTPEELHGRNLWALVHDEDRGGAKEVVRGAKTSATGWNGIVLRVRHKNGSYRCLQSNGVSVLDEQGRIRAFQGSNRDITDARLLEEQLRQSQKMEAVGRLAGGVAHDFNNLLAVIIGYAEIVRRKDPEGPHAAKIGEIEKAAQRAAGLTRQLLAFSRKQVLTPKVLDLGVILTDLGRMLPRLLEESVLLTLSTKPGLHSIKADPVQIEQVVMNLAVNARDAMPKGGELTLSTQNVCVDAANRQQYGGVPPGSYVSLSVRDTGCGMEAEVLSHIFEPFFTTKGSGQGTGLGLATVYGIVKQTGGHITVDSSPGAGSTFTIFLPSVRDAVAPSATAAIAPPRGDATVLLVEDEASLRALTREVLEGGGYRVLEAEDGLAALDVARAYAGPIHLVISDVVMPRMGGRELSERLALERPTAMVLFVSGYTADTIARQGVLEEGVRLLHKPFTPDALLIKVNDVLRASPTRAVEREEFVAV
jgi:PAS domain S-box-containing protein